MLASTKSRTFHKKNWQGKFIFSTKSITSHEKVSSKHMLGFLVKTSRMILMNFYKFYKSHPKSQSACLWFCSMNALTSYKSNPKSQMPVFDFVAWVRLQVSQVSPRCPKWPVFDFVAWVPLQDFTSQLKVSKMTGLWFCSMFSLNRNPKLVAQILVTRLLIL